MWPVLVELRGSREFYKPSLRAKANKNDQFGRDEKLLGVRQITSRLGHMKYAIAIVSALLGVSCGNGSSPATHESSASFSNDAATRWANDWRLETKHDVISETDTTHLVNELSPTVGGDKTKIRIDLTCPAPGLFAAEISVDPAIYVWQQTIQDVLGQRLLGAAGIPSDSVSTLVQWRAGKTIRKAYIPQGKYNNVVNIPKFLGFSEDE